MAISHEKEFGIYYWDTFDNETFLVAEADSLQEASDTALEKYGSQIRTTGADRVDIVDKAGNIVERYSVG